MDSTYYDQIAKGYDELHGEEQLQKIAVAKTLIMPKKNAKLLDVGCGSGISTRVWNCERYGIDPSKELIKIAKSNDQDFSENYEIEGAERIPYDNNLFDYVISFTAIQNFTDLKKGITEMHRVLDDKGKALITTLKRGPRKEIIEAELSKLFSIEKTIEENIDIIWVCKKK